MKKTRYFYLNGLLNALFNLAGKINDLSANIKSGGETNSKMTSFDGKNDEIPRG